MKLVIQILISFSLSFSSYLSMYGFGEYVEHDYGHSFITEPSDYFINNKYLKSIWDYSETMLSVQYNFKSSNLQDINLSDSYLASIAYTFPFSKSNYFTLGFNPYTISNVDFNINNYSYLSANEISTLDSPIAYNVSYLNNGGISKAYIGFLTKIFNKSYLGIKFSFLFGNLEQNKKIRLYDLEYLSNNENGMTVDTINYIVNDSILINRVNQYKGSSIQLELKHQTTQDIDFILSGTYNFPLHIKTDYFFNNYLNN